MICKKWNVGNLINVSQTRPWQGPIKSTHGVTAWCHYPAWKECRDLWKIKFLPSVKHVGILTANLPVPIQLLSKFYCKHCVFKLNIWILRKFHRKRRKVPNFPVIVCYWWGKNEVWISIFGLQMSSGHKIAK